MPSGELGTTGIKVSKFCFGSHMSHALLKYEKERGIMLREAYDLGITTFDVYENNMGRLRQWEPTGRHLAPVINDVVISILMMPNNGSDLMVDKVEEHLERALKMFRRDYIDMVRPPVYLVTPLEHPYMEKLFKLKQKGYIRAVGFPIHFEVNIDPILDTYPIDFMMFPYNFYHNCVWNGKTAGRFGAIVKQLREKGVGVVTMKPFGTENFIKPLMNAAKKLDETNEVSLPQAALRYIMNSGLNPDTTMGGMYNLDEVYEDAEAYFNPEMSREEKELLEKLRKVARVASGDWMPEHYKFLERWTPDSPDDEELYGSV